MDTLQQLLESGARPILAELDPPRDTVPEAFFDAARALHGAGADVITVADCPIGRASADACMVSARLRREYGILPLPHMACRDRNLNAMRAQLLGLDMEGIGQALLVTGDPVAQEDRGQVRGVFHYTAATLARALTDLTAQGRLPAFFLCGALNVNAANFDAELRRARQKEENGIRAFLTQPVLSTRAVDHLRRAREALHGFLLGGLYPIVSHKNALFLSREVNGMAVDDAVIAAYEGLDREEGEALGQRMCLDFAGRMAEAVDGYYIMTPFRRVELAGRVIGALRGENGHVSRG